MKGKIRNIKSGRKFFGKRERKYRKKSKRFMSKFSRFQMVLGRRKKEGK